MPILALFAPVIAFLMREIVAKFVVFAAVFGLVAVLAPVAIGYLGPYLTGGSLSSAFSGLSGSVWFFLDFFNLGFGIPLLISAAVTRFIIRRLPVIG